MNNLQVKFFSLSILSLLILGLSSAILITPSFAQTGTTRSRMENAYRIYRESNNEAFLRMQIIADLNFPDFIDAGKFIKSQRHERSTTILFELLRAYSRFDLLEEIFFGPGDGEFKAGYPEAYYETLLQNLKYDELLTILLNDFNEISRKIIKNPAYAPAKIRGSYAGTDNLYEMLLPLLTIFDKLRIIADRGPQQQHLVAEAVRRHQFKGTPATAYPDRILLSFIFSKNVSTKSIGSAGTGKNDTLRNGPSGHPGLSP